MRTSVAHDLTEAGLRIGVSLPGHTRRLVERSAQSAGELRCLVVCPEVEKEQTRLLIEHVTMDGVDLDPVRTQRLDYGINLIAG